MRRRGRAGEATRRVRHGCVSGGSDDQPALAEVTARCRLEPLEAYRGDTAEAPEPFDRPVWDDEASRDERFVGYVNKRLTLCEPIHPDEVDMFECSGAEPREVRSAVARRVLDEEGTNAEWGSVPLPDPSAGVDAWEAVLAWVDGLAGSTA